MTSLLSVPMLIGGATYMHLESKNKLAAQAGDAQQLIETLIVEKEQTEFLYAEQVETNHNLSQALTEKEGTIQLLGKRVFDVESVLGLADEELHTDEVSLEDRIDAAAVDSAVRATMFRLILMIARWLINASRLHTVAVLTQLQANATTILVSTLLVSAVKIS